MPGDRLPTMSVEDLQVPQPVPLAGARKPGLGWLVFTGKLGFN
jgi:hypothetical protein